MPKSKKAVKRPTSARLLKNRPVETEEEAEAQALGEPLDFDGKGKKPKQARLPEMDDPIIEDLETAAEDYAEVRDERMALTAKETDKKDVLLTLMKRHKRDHYKRDGIEITRVVEGEKIKVRITKEE